MKKRLLSLLLAVVLMAGCLPLSASAEMISYPVSGGSVRFDLSTGEIYGMDIDDEITELEIPAEIRGVKVVSVSVDGYGLTSISIPDSVTEIFFSDYLKNLTEIKVDRNNPMYTSQGGALFNKARTRLLYCPRGKTGSYSIPEGVTGIEEEAFAGCDKITHLLIPKSITRIEWTMFHHIDRWSTLICDLPALKSMEIPNTVEIGDRAFYEFNFDEFVIPEGITSIGKEAFGYCSNLTTVTIPLSMKNIGEGAFYGSKLEKVYYLGGTQDGWEKINFGSRNEPLFRATLLFEEEKEDPFIPYDLYTDTGEVLLTIWFPPNWAHALVDDYVNAPNNFYEKGWIFTDSKQNALFEIILMISASGHGVPDGYRIYKIGSVTLHGINYNLWFQYPNSSPYDDSDNSEAAVTYRELRSDIPAILRNVEQNSDLFWDWYLSDSGFFDVPESAYYSDAVKWAVDGGITSGTDELHFSPDDTCTRAQIVSFLWRAAGRPDPTNTAISFTDVEAGAYYEKAVQWAVENRITAGTSDTTFSPNDTCTRGQIVSFLWRAHGRLDPTNTSTSFRDVEAGAYYEKAVQWAVENRVTAGTSDTTFSPNDTCVRAQGVAFLWRAAGRPE